jgi:glycyl-tRNA synthetase beta chain
MTQMRKPIDTFFDKVMVMVEDEIIRNNRLALLDGIGQLFLKIADFSKLT